ncbi:MAG TPA: CAP domain-containing protein [Phycisphaerae bacterium]|nr:CAP domain-containing protein [Phycisphaerae bacterium]
MTAHTVKRIGRICCFWLLGSALLAVGCGVTSPAGGVGGNTGGTNLTALEQLSLERINRARLKPAAEAALYGISLNEGVPAGQQITAAPKQALSVNSTLTQVARDHSQDMLTRNYFAHDTPEGVTPFQRIQAAGYPFLAAGENLAWRGDTVPIDPPQVVEQQHVDLFVDSTVADRGHRTTMLQDVFREIGVGILRGNFTDGGIVYDSIMQTQDYGEPVTDSVFVLGVIYTDSNNNGQYDYGEGQQNVGVTLGGVTKTTNVGGGYSFEVLQPGSYTLQFAPGPSTNLTVNAGSLNIKVDLVNNTNVVINLGLGPL